MTTSAVRGTYFLDYRQSTSGEKSDGRVHFVRMADIELDSALALAKHLVEEVARYRNCRVCVTVSDLSNKPVARIWSVFDGAVRGMPSEA